MGRRKSASTADDLMDLVARLPWWGGVALAAVAYWGLHAVATRPAPTAPTAQTAQQLGNAVSVMLVQALAVPSQYLIPLLCLMGALASFMRRRKRQALFAGASQATGADALQAMLWQEFEMLVGEGFRRRGYAVRETGGGGADGGVDLVLRQGGETFLVQCKQWKAFKVGVATVRELYGVMAAEGAAGGFVVTSGRFTGEAEAFAAGRNIELVDGVALAQLLREGREGQVGQAAAASSAASGARDRVVEAERPRLALQPDQAVAATGPAVEPVCPRCAKPMVQRVAKKGAAAGKAFWGCSAYSAGCRGTREI